MAEGSFLPRPIHSGRLNFPASPAEYDAAAIPDVDVLKYLHCHPRDACVRFEPVKHEYFVNGVKMSYSVTGLIHRFSEAFRADEIINNMMRGHNWPRPGYLRPEICFDAIARLHLLHPDLLPLLAGNPRDEPRICDVLRRLARVHDLNEDIARLSLTPEEIKQKWAANAQAASHYGTYMHNLFEAFLNGYEVPNSSPEYRMLQQFLATLPSDVTAWRTEWVIYGEEEGLAGSIDFCAKKVDGTFVLVDWKRSAGLPEKCTSGKRMHAPLDGLRDCTVMHYTLQLNAYRYLLEKYYGVSVSEMYIVCCHPEHGDFPWIYPVSTLDAEVRRMMEPLIGFPDAIGGSALWVAEACWSILACHCEKLQSNFGSQLRGVDAQALVPRAERRRCGRSHLEPQDLQGGSLPYDVLQSVSISFSCPEHMLQLQACCRRLREILLDPRAWRHLSIHLDTFSNVSLCQFARSIRFIPVWSEASEIVVCNRHLGRLPLSALPQNLSLAWSLRQPEISRVFRHACFSWESTESLFGRAACALQIRQACGLLLVGIKKRDGLHPWPLLSQPRAIFCRIRKPFETDMEISFGRSDDVPVPALRIGGPLPGRRDEHLVEVRWDRWTMWVVIDGVALPALQVHPHVQQELGVFTKFFVRIFAPATASQAGFTVRPTPCPVQANSPVSCFKCQRVILLGSGNVKACNHCSEWFCAQHRSLIDNQQICQNCAAVWQDAVGGSCPRSDSLMCSCAAADCNLSGYPCSEQAEVKRSICERTHALVQSRWTVCILAGARLCRSHVEIVPFSNCPTQLDDYLGGSLVQQSDVYTITCAYQTACSIWQSIERSGPLDTSYTWEATESSDGRSKSMAVICDIMRERSACLRQHPMAVHFLPHPAERGTMSKRAWEVLMYRARTFLGLLDQQQDLVLFMYTHAIAAASLPASQSSFMQNLPHPNDAKDNIVAWRTDACHCALRVHVAIARCRKERSAYSVHPTPAQGLHPADKGSLSADSSRLHDYAGGASPAANVAASQDSFAARVDQELQEEMAGTDMALADIKEERIEAAAANIVLEGPEDADDKVWEVLKKRRLLPGAATSDQDFDSLFAGLEASRVAFQNDPADQADQSNSIPQIVQKHKFQISTDFPDLSEYMTNLMTAAVAVLSLRTVDVFQRENAMMLFIIEGEKYMRFHHGDCYVLHASGAFQHYKGLPLDCSRVHRFLLHLEGLST